jgi:hypothetical protein
MAPVVTVCADDRGVNANAIKTAINVQRFNRRFITPLQG